jgi:hypothetical protein
MGSPFVHTPAAPGPPRTQLPKTKAETVAELPKSKSAIGKKPRAGSVQAGIQKMAAAARERREREAGSAGAGPSNMADEADDEVECVGSRTREDRDAELRAQAVDVDGA